MKIKVIYPVSGQFDLQAESVDFAPYFSEESVYDIQVLDYAPESLETEYDTVLAIPDLLLKVKQAERDGYDGVFISCFADPGVRAARECTIIPVVGGFEPAMLCALGLADRIGIMKPLAESVPGTAIQIRQMGIADRVVSLRYVDIPVLALGDTQALLEALYQESRRAIADERVQCLVLGCTGMLNVAKRVQKKLLDAGYDIPVIDPNFAAIQLLEAYIRMDVRPSKLTYPFPLEKRRRWWSDVAF